MLLQDGACERPCTRSHAHKKALKPAAMRQPFIPKIVPDSHGSLMSKSECVVMSCWDRVAIGGELLLFDNPAARPAGVAGEGEGADGSVQASVPPTPEFAVEELQAALRNKGKQAQEVCATRDMNGLTERMLVGLVFCACFGDINMWCKAVVWPGGGLSLIHI